jgi:hypothetical protein
MLAGIVVVAVVIYRGFIALGSDVPTVPARSSSPACRGGDPLANVFTPGRLQVVTDCTAVRVIVLASFQDPEDGDYHVNLKPDPEFEQLLNHANLVQVGTLVVELVPADQAGCMVGQPPRPPHVNEDYGICTGANVAVPSAGDHVEVIGPYVLDRDHGWMEIHPAWHFQLLD